MKTSFPVLILFCLLIASCSEDNNTSDKDFSAGLALAADVVESNFNASAWNALKRAESEQGIEIEYRVAKEEDLYDDNLDYFVRNDFAMVFSSGFLLKDVTIKYAAANPNKYFAMIDVYNDTTFTNLIGISFSMENVCFLAGYLAAGFSKTGVVATFGGIALPPVKEFLTGYKNGVEYYNETKNASVRFLGENLFTNDFESKEIGRKVTDSLIAEGADVILPVTGTGAMGALESVNQHNVYMVGTNIDWRQAYPDISSNIITSVEKNIDNSVYTVLSQAIKGNFESGNYIGTLKNEGVALSPFYSYDDEISPQLKAEIEQLKEDFMQ
jgi:basic membrane protein A